MATGDRKDYYNKWDKFGEEVADEIDAEDAAAAEEAKRDLGQDDAAPKSEAEARDMAKRAALKEAKKKWDAQKQAEAAMRFEVTGKEGAELSIDEDELGARRVLVFKGNKGCTFTVPAGVKLIKLFVEDCEDCKLRLGCSLITDHLEVSHCERTELRIEEPLKTLQLDLCSELDVVYPPGVFREGDFIYHAGVSKSRFTVKGATAEFDYLAGGAKAEGQACAEEYQFETTVGADGELRTGKVMRTTGTGHAVRGAGAGGVLGAAAAAAAGGGDAGQAAAAASEAAAGALDEEATWQLQEAEAQRSKLGGAEAFKDAEYAQAAVYYSKAIEQAPPARDGSGAPNPIVAICHSNRAACFLKLGQPEKALEDAEKCCELNPDFVKGYFRRGLALHALTRYGEAIKFLEQALNREPKNKQVMEAIKFAEFKARQQAAGKA
eukprot:g5813.t1